MNDNAPVYGCDGCNTTGGRMSCPAHGTNGVDWLGDSFREIERLQGLLAAQDREYNAENLRAERFKRERDEARKALDSIWEVVRTGVYGPPYDFHLGQLASIRGFIDIERAARVAGGGEDE